MDGAQIELVQTRLGQPAVIGRDADGNDIWSSIDRQPTTATELYLTWTGLTGDQPTVTRPKAAKKVGEIPGQRHGGNDKAVYVYSAEHYQAWVDLLGSQVMEGRSLGENWRVRGVTETSVCIGDVWEIGDAVLKVSMPRQPCTTLELYFGGLPMIKYMYESGLCGWYMQVLRPGLVLTTGIIRVTPKGGQTMTEAFADKVDV